MQQAPLNLLTYHLCTQSASLYFAINYLLSYLFAIYAAGIFMCDSILISLRCTIVRVYSLLPIFYPFHNLLCKTKEPLNTLRLLDFRRQLPSNAKCFVSNKNFMKVGNV